MTEEETPDIDCPRCGGTGGYGCQSLPGVPYEESFDVSELCRLCGGSGRTTQKMVDWWYKDADHDGWVPSKH